jgi:hypothetical protein
MPEVKVERNSWTSEILYQLNKNQKRILNPNGIFIPIVIGLVNDHIIIDPLV